MRVAIEGLELTSVDFDNNWTFLRRERNCFNLLKTLY